MNREMLMLVDAISREKNVDRESAHEMLKARAIIDESTELTMSALTGPL